MQKIIFSSKIELFGFAFLLVCISATMIFAQSAAPVGTYVATEGSSNIKGKSGAAGQGGGLFKKRFNKQESAESGNTVTINLQSYSTKDEINQLKAAQANPQQFMTALSSFNHGTVSVNGKSYPINMASSVSRNGKFVISILSAKAFSASSEAKSTAGKAINTGHIEMVIDANGAGQGIMHESTHIGIDSDGIVSAKGGGMLSKATQLTNVSRK